MMFELEILVNCRAAQLPVRINETLYTVISVFASILYCMESGPAFVNLFTEPGAKARVNRFVTVALKGVTNGTIVSVQPNGTFCDTVTLKEPVFVTAMLTACIETTPGTKNRVKSRPKIGSNNN